MALINDIPPLALEPRNTSMLHPINPGRRDLLSFGRYKGWLQRNDPGRDLSGSTYDLRGAYRARMGLTPVTHDDGLQYYHMGTLGRGGKFLKQYNPDGTESQKMSWNLGIEEEQRLGSKIVKGLGGSLYSKPGDYRVRPWQREVGIESLLW